MLPPHHCLMTHQPPWKHSATSKCTVWRFIWALEMQDVEDPELWEALAHVAAGRRWGPQCEPWLSLKIEVQPTSLDGGGSDLWVWAVVFCCDSCASPLVHSWFFHLFRRIGFLAEFWVNTNGWLRRPRSIAADGFAQTILWGGVQLYVTDFVSGPTSNHMHPGS